jgi:hypothetical protein
MPVDSASHSCKTAGLQLSPLLSEWCWQAPLSHHPPNIPTDRTVPVWGRTQCSAVQPRGQTRVHHGLPVMYYTGPVCTVLNLDRWSYCTLPVSVGARLLAEKESANHIWNRWMLKPVPTLLPYEEKRNETIPILLILISLSIPSMDGAGFGFQVRRCKIRHFWRLQLPHLAIYLAVGT